MPTPLEECAEKRATYNKVANEIQTIILALGEIHSALQREWSKTVIIPSGGAYPIELAGGRTIQANKWPTAQQCDAALRQYHTTHFEWGQAWTRLPADQQGQFPELRPPN